MAFIILISYLQLACVPVGGSCTWERGQDKHAWGWAVPGGQGFMCQSPLSINRQQDNKRIINYRCFPFLNGLN